MSPDVVLLLVVLAVVVLIAALGIPAFLILHAAAGPTPEPEPTSDPGLRALAERLARVRVSRLAEDTMRVEGRLRGERLSAQVRPASEAIRSEVRVEAQVPVQLTGTFLRGKTGPRLANDGEPDPRLREAGPDHALRALLQRVDEVKLGLSGVDARSREPLGAVSLLATVEALIALAGFVRTDAPLRPVARARVLATRTRASSSADAPPKVVGRGAQVCPFCRDDIDAGAEDAVACAGCTTLHHSSCWDENGRCTVRGCEQVRAERVTSGRVPDL